jgi:hypothetical protein
MNIQTVTDESLRMLYQGVRNAIKADVDAVAAGKVTPCATLETADWREHAAALENEMVKRGMEFDAVTFPDGKNSTWR